MSNKRAKVKKVLKWTGIILGLLSCILGSFILYWIARPNTSNIDPTLQIETWTAVYDGWHNSNTDLIYWNGSYFLIHDHRPFHLGSPIAKLRLWNSSDAHNWNLVTEFNAPGEDIRDPKFANISGRLFLYALKNKGVIAEPYVTVFTYTDDGVNWQPLREIAHPGWLFWRPKTFDNITWYVSAYWHDHGQSILLNSTDGENWTVVSGIWQGLLNDETAIEFLPDGRIISTARLEGYRQDLFGDNFGCTLISVSSFPYTNWTYTISTLARLDGPVLFNYSGKVFAIGRFEPEIGPIFNQLGSFFTRKRTSLYLVTEGGLIHLSDLPSAGDTSYPGVVLQGDQAYISYYTSNILQDIPWILGVISPTEIRMAKINMTRLVTLADTKLASGVQNSDSLLVPWLDYIVLFWTILAIASIWYVIRIYKPKKNKT